MTHRFPLVRSTCAVLVLAASLAACASAGVPASAAVAEPGVRANGGRIDGFASVPWGATREQVQAARGAPDTVIAYGGGVVGLGYPEPDGMYGAEVRSVFLVHPEHGFFRGVYDARPERAEECERVLGRMEQEVRDRYPALEPRSRDVNGSALPFCEALRNGQAARLIRWRDAAGTEIVLMATPGTAEITLGYSHPRANEWEAARSRANP